MKKNQKAWLLAIMQLWKIELLEFSAPVYLGS